MKKCITLTILLFLSSHILIGQEKKDSIMVNYVYPPDIYEHLSAEESWGIYKVAYIKKLKMKGLTDKEIKKSIANYEKYKDEYIARVKENLKLAEEKRKEHAKLRDQQALIREQQTEVRKQQALIREQQAEVRKQQAKLRLKAENQRKRNEKWRESSETILIENLTLKSNLNTYKPIVFNVSSQATLRIGVRAHISSGSALIEIYNPNGVKKGELSLDFNPSNKNEKLTYTSGALDKTIFGAKAGEWEIKIKSQKSNGQVAISVAQNENL